ncbi:unnamed protein product, partial [marine sediment metagenome]
MAKIFETQFHKGSYIDRISKVAGTPSSISFKRIEKGLAPEFDGSNSKLDMGFALDLLGNTTCVAWLKYRGFGEGIPASRGIAFSNGKFNIGGMDTGKLSFSRDGSTTATTPNNSIVLNQYILVIITSTTAGLTNFYKNGILIGSADQSAGTPEIGTDNITIGNFVSGASRTFNGWIGEIEIHDKILNTKERAQAYEDFLNARPLFEEKHR